MLEELQISNLSQLTRVQSVAVRAGFISRTYTDAASKTSFIRRTRFYSGVNINSSRDLTEILVKPDSISSPGELNINCPAPSAPPAPIDG